MVAITSEPQSLASEAVEAWELDFDAIGDPHHEILADCRARGWIDLFIADASRMEADREWAAHPNGYFQAGTLAVTAQGRVLYRWRSRPTRRNRGGASGRAKPAYVWEQVQAAFERDGDAALDDAAELDAPESSWLVFVAKLLAHGWFVRPKTFPLGRPDDPQSESLKAMRPRLVGFAALWAGAAVFLPLRWVVGAFTGYAAAIAPSIVQLHRDFQNVPEARNPQPRNA